MPQSLCVGEKSVSQGAVLPPTWDDRRHPALVKSEPVLAKSGFAIPNTTRMQEGFFSCCRAGKDLTCCYRWGCHFSGGDGSCSWSCQIAESQGWSSQLQPCGCSLVTVEPLLTARKGDSERDRLGAQGLEAERWAFASGWLLGQLHICL